MCAEDSDQTGTYSKVAAHAGSDINADLVEEGHGAHGEAVLQECLQERVG